MDQLALLFFYPMDTFVDIFSLIVEFLVSGSDIAVMKFAGLPANSRRRIVRGIL